MVTSAGVGCDVDRGPTWSSRGRQGFLVMLLGQWAPSGAVLALCSQSSSGSSISPWHFNSFSFFPPHPFPMQTSVSQTSPQASHSSLTPLLSYWLHFPLPCGAWNELTAAIAALPSAHVPHTPGTAVGSPSPRAAQLSSAQPTCPLVPSSFLHPAALHTLCFQCRTRSGAQINSQVLNGCLEITLFNYYDDSLLLLSLLLLFNVIFASGSTSPTPQPLHGQVLAAHSVSLWSLCRTCPRLLSGPAAAAVTYCDKSRRNKTLPVLSSAFLLKAVGIMLSLEGVVNLRDLFRVQYG